MFGSRALLRFVLATHERRRWRHDHVLLGVVLLIVAAAMVVLVYLSGRRDAGSRATDAPGAGRRAATLAIGILGGIIVGYDLGRVGLADDRAADVALPDAVVQ